MAATDPDPDDETAAPGGSPLAALAAAADTTTANGRRGRDADGGRGGRRGRRRRTWGQRFGLLGLLVLTVVCLLAASTLSWTITKVDQQQVYADLGRAFAARPEQPAGAPENFLLVGVDDSSGLDPDDPINAGREGERNSDTMIIARVDPAAPSVALLSLPRDLLVTIGGPGGQQAKLNAAYQYGQGVLIDTIKANLDIDVDHYIEVDLNGFRRLVDELGGIPMQFDKPLRDTHSDLYQYEVGCVTLDAQQSLGLARSRYLEAQENGQWVGTPGDDYARVRRQQELIRAAVRRAVTTGARNPKRASDLIDVGLATVRTDPRLTLGDLVDLAGSFRAYDPADIATFSLSTTEETHPYAGAVLRLQQAASLPVLEIFRGHSPLQELRALVRVEVRNGTGERDKAAQVAFELGANHFTVTRFGDGYERGRPTRIVYGDPAYKVNAVILARYLDVPAAIEEGQVDDPTSAVALEVGSDYTGLRATPRPLSDFRLIVPELFPAESSTTPVTGPEPELTLQVPTAIVRGEVPKAPETCLG